MEEERGGREEGRKGGREGSGETFLYLAEHQSRYCYILKSAPAYPLKNVARDGEVFMCCAAATRAFVLVGNGIRDNIQLQMDET